MLVTWVGSDPAAVSAPSQKPSRSLSGSFGSVPVSAAPTNVPVAVSTPSSRPSPSLSATTGSVPVSVGLTYTPVPVSTLSVRSSSSVSGSVGSVIRASSPALSRRSPSGSSVPTQLVMLPK